MKKENPPVLYPPSQLANNASFSQFVRQPQISCRKWAGVLDAIIYYYIALDCNANLSHWLFHASLHPFFHLFFFFFFTYSFSFFFSLDAE